MGDASIDVQAAFYDARWEGFGTVNRLRMRRAAEILRHLSDARLRDPAILELGCGAGWLTAMLAHFGAAHGVDLSPAAIADATRRYPMATFECADALSWRPDRRYDVVVSHEVLEHVPDQRRYLDVAHAALRPGGLLVLTTPNARTMRAMSPGERAAWTDQPIEDWRTRRELRSLALEAGFGSIRTSTILPGKGRRGVRYALLNTAPAYAAVRLGRRAEYDALRSTLGMGLHLVLVARA